MCRTIRSEKRGTQLKLTLLQRGQYYGIAAAVGKIGAFVGSYVFPIIKKHAPNPTRAGQDPFFVGSALAIFSGFLALFFLPEIGQDTIEEEDIKFREYLERNGYDTSQMGTRALLTPNATGSAEKVGKEGEVV
jgi:MFS family permease